MTLTAFLWLIFVALPIGMLVIAFACDRWTKRHKPNRRRGLPKPSKEATRSYTPEAVT